MANYYNYKKALAIQKSNEERWQKLYPALLNNKSGIYILTREDEHGLKYAYVGQAKHLLKRLGQHLSGYQHIDLSLKKHKLFNENNPTGWKLEKIIYCEESKLDELERFYIKEFANGGYQLRNKTVGGQNVGKSGMDEIKPTKGYHDGLKQGYKNCLKDIKVYFDKYLYPVIKDKPTKIKEKKLQEFIDLLE